MSNTKVAVNGLYPPFDLRVIVCCHFYECIILHALVCVNMSTRHACICFLCQSEKRSDDAESTCKRLMKENEKLEGKVHLLSRQRLFYP